MIFFFYSFHELLSYSDEVSQGVERSTGAELSAKRKCLKALEAKLWGRVWSGISVEQSADIQPSELEMLIDAAPGEPLDLDAQAASNEDATPASSAERAEAGGAAEEVRAALPDRQLSAEQLALALTDMATDRCLLAHAYSNWEPWF